MTEFGKRKPHILPVLALTHSPYNAFQVLFDVSVHLPFMCVILGELSPIKRQIRLVHVCL